MKNPILKLFAILSLSLCLSNLSLASSCLELHQSRAIKKAEKVWRGKRADFYHSMSNNGFKFVGGSWIALGVGFAPTLAASGPIILGGIIVGGGLVLTKSILDSIEEPRYTMINHMIRKNLGLPYINIYSSKIFNRLLNQAQKRRSDITSEQLEDRFVTGIQSGEFCEDGKPYSYKRMKKLVLGSI